MTTEIIIFPMKNLPDGSAALCEPPDDPDSYDVLVQDEDGDVIVETDDLATFDEAAAAAEKYLLEFPDADINFGEF